MAEKSEPLLQVITSEEEFNLAVESSENFVIVLDAHKKWCGPCEAMWPTFASIKQATQKCNDRMKLYSVEIDEFGELIQSLLPDEAKAIDGRGCSPMFLVLRHKHCKAAIEGCNSPQLEIDINTHMPPTPQEE